MSSSLHQFGRDVMSGEARGISATLLRGAMTIAEPIYATAMRARNAMYDRGIKTIHKLPRPTVSVGNITTGGTGKTPVVAWLAQQFRSKGLRSAIILRGYKARDAVMSDEQRWYEEHFGDGDAPPPLIHANPDRVVAADDVVIKEPKVDLFILDDAFQHRRVARNFDLVLINASDPFGFNHILPRGLLREPLSGLKRASAFLLTHGRAVGFDSEIQRTLRRFNPTAPIFRCDHIHTALRTASGDLPIDEIRSKKIFAFAGIGDPKSFGASLANLVGHHWFADHHHYTDADLAKVCDEAKQAGADLIVTTEKDWVKVSRLKDVNNGTPFSRIVLALKFQNDDEQKLFSAISASLR